MLPGVCPLGNFWSLAFQIMQLQVGLLAVVIRFTETVLGFMGMLFFFVYVPFMKCTDVERGAVFLYFCNFPG